VDYDIIDGPEGLLLEIRPIEYPVSVREQHDYIVLVGGRTLTLKKRILGRVRGDQ
jgi:hypothetical protein